MVAYMLEGLFTYIILCQATHTYIIYILHQHDRWKTSQRHFLECHELDHIKFRPMEIFTLDINRLTVFSFLAVSVSRGILPII